MLNFNIIDELVESGYVSKRPHPDKLLWVLNYTPKAQYDWNFTEEVRACRGLVVDSENNIVARPFKKFFSLKQLNGILPEYDSYEVYEKLDGSMIVLFNYKGEWILCTRGSFQSRQALEATELLKTYDTSKLNPDLTYLLEYVSPTNQIVVRYDVPELKLLGIIETSTGKEFNINTCDVFPKTKFLNLSLEELQEYYEDNFEGFVVKFYPSGDRVKFKLKEYEEKHKVMTGMNERTIWQYLVDDVDLKPILELDNVPDDFYNFIVSTSQKLFEEFEFINSECKFMYYKVKDMPRKDAALYMKNFVAKSVVFAMLDGKEYKNIIWKMVYPETVTNTYKLN